MGSLLLSNATGGEKFEKIQFDYLPQLGTERLI